jgi:hypothetical protein
VNPHREATVPTSASYPTSPTISHRDRRLLHAVADGRVECSGGVHADFFVDGIPCCDHVAARALARAGLIRAATTAPDGRRLPVRLTAAGQAALSAPRHARTA